MFRSAGPQAELVGQLVHFFFELHQGKSDALHLLVAETAAFHAAYGLSFEQLAQELDQRQHELRQPLLDAFRVDVDPARQRAAHLLELALGAPRVRRSFLLTYATPTKVYGGHGPLTSIRTSCSARASRALTLFARSSGDEQGDEQRHDWRWADLSRTSTRSRPASRSISSPARGRAHGGDPSLRNARCRLTQITRARRRRAQWLVSRLGRPQSRRR